MRKLTLQREEGFTLIEFMILVGIIGVLAAIAVPQFMAYRMRSYNATAKATVRDFRTDQSNLNTELGVYGHTEATAAALSAPDAGAGPADTFTVPQLRSAATPTTPGARLVGTTNDGSRSLAIGVSIGHMMTADVQDINDASDDSTFHATARHTRGDTAYAIDNDVNNALLSVSNAQAWPNSPGLMATPVPPALPHADDIDNQPGGGMPTVNWTRTR